MIKAATMGVVVALGVATAKADQGTIPGHAATSEVALAPVMVSVGLSTMVTPPWPVKRVSVTEPKIADVQVLAPKQRLISGKAVGATDLILWNKDEEAIRMHVDVQVDRTQVKSELEHMLPKANLEVRQA